MLQKTRGIVLKTTDYRESSVIAQLFTEDFGVQSYIINGVRKSRSRVHQNILQPLHLLELVVYHKQGANLQRVKEIRNHPAFHTIPLDIVKSTQCLFLCEVLFKCLRGQQAGDPRLFGYIFHSLELLDHQDKEVADFHIHFLFGLSRFLGFYPDSNQTNRKYFNLQDGSFTDQTPAHPYYIGEPLTGLWYQLACRGTEQTAGFSLRPALRKPLLDSLLEYYALHMAGFGKIKSLDVLHAVFD